MRVVGETRFERATTASQTQSSNQTELLPVLNCCFVLNVKMVRAVGFEPTTRGLENRCSIPLSYARTFKRLNRVSLVHFVQGRLQLPLEIRCYQALRFHPLSQRFQGPTLPGLALA